MEPLLHISAPKCVLLAIRYASDANVPALRTITRSRFNDLQATLLLRIILTYLPESADPSSYTSFCHEVTSGTFAEEPQDVQLDLSILNNVSDKKARARVNKAQLLPISHTAYSDVELDELTAFLIHRAHRIDSETGIFDLIPTLIVPFLEQSEYLRTWFISTCLPLLRQEYEYYPSYAVVSSLDSFTSLNDAHAVETLLSRALETSKPGIEATNNIGRDIRGLVGPWVYGSTERKRRKLSAGKRRHSVAAAILHHEDSVDGGDTSEAHGWEYVFRWLVSHAVTEFPSVLVGIQEWDGPGDIDLGGYEISNQNLSEELQEKLELRYAQAALATAYTVDADTEEAIEGAHTLLVRLATLMDYEHPPDLATSVDMLPRIESTTSTAFRPSPTALQIESLLNSEHPLTTPSKQTFAILQTFVYAAYTLASLGHRISVKSVARLRFFNDEEEQKQMLQNLLYHATTTLSRDDDKWLHLRAKLLWLWNWGLKDQKEDVQVAFGIFDKLDRAQFETEILKSLLKAERYKLVVQTYIKGSEPHQLTSNDAEKVIVEVALHYFDTASNGNRTRGNMKKASEIVSTFKPHFSSSESFSRTEALLAAAHSLSFYIIKLDKRDKSDKRDERDERMPFQPVDIRAISDPISLIQNILKHNPQKHSEIDKLFEIAQHLVNAGVGTKENPRGPNDDRKADLEEKQRSAWNRVLGMATQASLDQGDFSTAYSNVTTKSNPYADTSQGNDQDGPWHAASIAASHEASKESLSYTKDEDVLKYFRKKLELFSHALLTAPVSELPGILAVWKECEKKYNKLEDEKIQNEQDADDKADRVREPPGGFDDERQNDVNETQRQKRERSRNERAGKDWKQDQKQARRQDQKYEEPKTFYRFVNEAIDVGKRHMSGGTESRNTTTRPARQVSDSSEHGMEEDEDSDTNTTRTYTTTGFAGTAANLVVQGVGRVLGAKPVDRNGY